MTNLCAVEQPAELPILSAQVNSLHRKITGERRNVIPDAIRCGELLLTAQREVAKGQWVAWMRENLDVHPTTAFGYMRLANHKDQVLAGNFTGIDVALDALSSKSLTPEAKLEMKRLHKAGMGLTEIAKMFGVAKSTVYYYVSEKARNRIKRLQRAQRQRERRALEREQERAAIHSQKGPLADAYSAVRRAEQSLDFALADKEIDYEKRQAMLEALNALYAAEDNLVKASKLT